MSRSSPSNGQFSAWRQRLEFLTTLALLAVAITILWLLFTGGALPRPSPTRHAEKGPRGAAATPPLPSAPISIEGTRTKGKASATVALIEYSDFQCPWCGVYARETYPTLAKQYVDTGKLLMVFRHLPITSIHPLATKAAEAAECAGRQNKFWEMHDLLFLRQKELSSPSLVSRANALGLDAMAFSTCLEGQAASVVEADGQSARRMGITGTPTFLVGRVLPDGRIQLVERLQGAKSVEEFGAIIDKHLKAQ